jgi:integrase
MSELNPDLLKNLRDWWELKLAHLRHGRAIYTRCLRVVSWAYSQDAKTITSWMDFRPTLIDKFLKHRLEPTCGAGVEKVVKSGTVARDVAAVKLWLEWNEESELTGPIRSRYLAGRVTDKREISKFALSDEQAGWLLQRSMWIYAGQSSLKFEGTAKRAGGAPRMKSATCTHWRPGAFHLFVRFGLELGLRPRELFWLAWEDFSRGEDGRIAVEVQDHGEGNRVLNEVKKGSFSHRRLILPADLARELEDCRESWGGTSARRFLFAYPRPDKPGGWIKPEISFIFKALKREMNEPRLVCNTLRKTCGQRLRRAGLDYFAIAQFLGHSATTCMRYYVSDCRDTEAFDPATCKPVQLIKVAAM